ncbi:hypothetical protein [Pelagicoccus sp. SDUM812003]|uniref:hypothetical protein n=1 Tax=Pelagicoccus sp. SDUM812003 TaxID=3041267 RepID=UPI00280D14BC|nr:hypothetical protein [Pelagicoccus sp. SDUM812003]MDQ8202007.1 hypothetical protein [Pelagicoccus sp. SDUM812003]
METGSPKIQDPVSTFFQLSSASYRIERTNRLRDDENSAEAGSMLEAELNAYMKADLERLQRGIESGDGDAVKKSIASLDKTLSDHRRAIDPQLKHFLKNRSYQKALMLLNHQTDIPRGRCQGRTDFS